MRSDLSQHRPVADHRSIDAVLFDLGDTVIQFGKVNRLALFENAARRTYELWARRQKRMPGFRRYYLHQWFAMHWGYLKQRLLRREMSAMRYIRRACRKLWLEAEEEFYRELAWTWYQPLAEVARIEPGTHDALDALRRDGYRLGLVSNTFVPGFVLDRHLRRLDLLRFFPVRIYSCDVGYRKPDARIFHMAADALDAAPDQCVFVGDSLDADVAGARAAGLFPIWKRPTQPPRASCDDVLTIDRLSELPGDQGAVARLNDWLRAGKLAG